MTGNDWKIVGKHKVGGRQESSARQVRLFSYSVIQLFDGHAAIRFRCTVPQVRRDQRDHWAEAIFSSTFLAHWSTVIWPWTSCWVSACVAVDSTSGFL